MTNLLHPVRRGTVRLLPGLFLQRYQLNRSYMLSLKTENLLQNHYLEAGLWSPAHRLEDIHWGWEAPSCQLRGHFLGHWLSAAASIGAATGDQEVKGKADYIVSELARCQQENGGEWAGSIPEKYLDWVARGKPVWAPHYTLHKTLMGLWDMYAVGGNAQALEILVRWARWFSRWSGQFTQAQMEAILEVETGGMLEVWANLYGLTGDAEHRELLQRYDRRRFFDPLVAGQEVLTNLHMNTTIPEVQGAARAWEVTGDPRWRQIVDAYWRHGVVARGTYVTGGQTNGEVWSPPGALSARLGQRTQEHCTVYNMMRLADSLLRWSGESVYADYWERNLWNGILAQQHPETGMIAYFLPLHAGAEKVWGSPTEDFWCCHGSLVQAQTIYADHIWYEVQGGLVLSQYIPSELAWQQAGQPVCLRLTADAQLASAHRPNSLAYTLEVQSSQPVEFVLRLRLPWWLSSEVEIHCNGERCAVASEPSGYVELRRIWHNDRIHLLFPKTVVAVPLPDEPNLVGFMDGPVVLAGLNPGEDRIQVRGKNNSSHTARPNHRISGLTLYGEASSPGTFLVPDNEREWSYWRGDYRTRGQEQAVRLIPLYEVRDEVYTVYFNLQPPGRRQAAVTA
jgi:DUF1680 family protein